VLAVLFSLGTAVLWGAADFLGGLKSRVASTLAVVAIAQTAGLVPVALVVVVTGQDAPSQRHLLYGAGAGLITIVGLSALYRGLAVGSMSIVAPIGAAGAVVPVAVGIGRGEQPSWVQGAGMLLVLAGVVFASREPDRGSDRTRLAAGVGLGLLSALCLGLFYVAFDAASEGSTSWAVLMQRTAFVAVVVPIALVRWRRLTIGRRDVPVVALIGLLDVAALALLAEATTRGLVSVVSVIASLYPVTTVVLAHILLGERIAVAQRAGVVGAFAGVALVTAG
jgi:uncharacterized membrane protein